MSNIYFIRHGQSRANLDGTIAGWFDSPLTVKGIEQAKAVAHSIKASDTRFDVIYSSTLSRAYDTAATIAEAISYPVSEIIKIDDLREKSGGDFENGPKGKLSAATDQERVDAHAESSDDFYKRVEGVNRIIAATNASTILIVAHAGIYKMAQCVSQGLSPNMVYVLPDPDNGQLLEYPHTWPTT